MTYVLPHTHNSVFMIQQTVVSTIILGEEVLPVQKHAHRLGAFNCPKGCGCVL